MMGRPWFVVVVLLGVSESAEAQSRPPLRVGAAATVQNAFGRHRVSPPGWGYGWPAFGFYPSYIDGFWSNGLSAYGPPVPSYGPRAGVFGASDDLRFWGKGPGFGYGLGWFGYRSPSPRPTPSVSVFPPGPTGTSAPRPLPIQTQEAVELRSRCLTMTVLLPDASAKVFIDDQPTQQTGTDRLFHSPPIDGEEAISYRIRAEWMVDGKPVRVSKIVGGIAGTELTLDFRKPE